MSDRKQNRTDNGTDRLQEIRARLDAATPGQPWVVVHLTYVEPHSHILVGNEAWQDAIDHAPADIAWLLDEVERLRKYAVHGHNDCWQSGECVCGLESATSGPPEVDRKQEGDA